MEQTIFCLRKPYQMVKETGIISTEPKEKEILIGIKVRGICGSDILAYQGKHVLLSFPRVLGHEFSGVVEKIGPKVEKVKVGDRVCAEPLIPCKNCHMCQRGSYNVCENLKVLGIHTDGAFREKIIVKEEMVHKIPENISLEEAALIEPFSVALEVLRRTRLSYEDTLCIFGMGTIGLCILKGAKVINPQFIVAVDVIKEKLEFARKLGADLTIDASRENVEEKIMNVTKGKGIEVIIEASGSQNALMSALKVCAYRGRFGFLAFYKNKGVKILPEEIVKKELDIYGSRLYWHRFPLALNLLSKGKISLKDLITSKFPFENTIQAMEKALQGKDIKIVIG
ncbi:alcohol dehydrogenase catalytic domain-containing protein [Candidatus Aerophobetes bacterium]|nr:alcohol dehydrogenase catalytic domain-containing protein [Candidatus Aerophobetes bacterium]